MKIGILTFHCAHNYGAVLQCYALQETLKSFGYEVEVIDYRPQYLLSPYKRFDISWFKRKNIFLSFIRLIKEIQLVHLRKSRYDNFELFISKYLNLSSAIGRTLPIYDLYVIGSDQVWNKSITNGYDSIFWGDFHNLIGNKKIISYAASIGDSEITDSDKDIIIKYLNNFTYISVRENFLKNILSKITSKKINLVIDPTLLVNESIWNNIIKYPQTENYVLVYQNGNNENILRIAYNIALELNTEVIEITSNFLRKNNHKTIYDCSPEFFLGYIKKSKIVITSTFHGTAFSIIFRKPFYSIINKKGTRVKSLLSVLNLSNRLIEQSDNPKYNDIDYSSVNHLINKIQKESNDYLTEAICDSI